jgi:hypothetical protein
VFQLVRRDLATLSLSAIFLFLFPLVSVPIFSLSNQVLDARHAPPSLASYVLS